MLCAHSLSPFGVLLTAALALTGCSRSDAPPAAAGTATPPATVAAAPPPAPMPDPAPASTPAPTPAPEPAPAPATAPAPAPGAAANGALYQVVDGYKVDANTMAGFRAWRAAACDRCHGANQEGMVGPSLIASLKTLTKEEFVTTVRDGRLEKGMQSFGNSKIVMDNIDHLYAYLKGRSDGAITRAKVEPMS